MPTRCTGDLNMGDAVDMLIQPRGDVPANNLGVIDIELQFQPRVIKLFKDHGRLFDGIKQITRHIKRIDRLDQDIDPGLIGKVRSIKQIVAIKPGKFAGIFPLPISPAMQWSILQSVAAA